MIRSIASADIEPLLDIAEAVYPAFDRVQAGAWARAVLGKPDVAILRCGDSAVIATVTQAFWGGPRLAYLLFAFGRARPQRIWEVLRLLRAVEEWRKERGAEAFHFGEQTGIDFAPIAKRLGAKLGRPTFVLEGGAVKRPQISKGSVLDLALSGVGRANALQQAIYLGGFKQ